MTRCLPTLLSTVSLVLALHGASRADEVVRIEELATGRLTVTVPARGTWVLRHGDDVVCTVATTETAAPFTVLLDRPSCRFLFTIDPTELVPEKQLALSLGDKAIALPLEKIEPGASPPSLADLAKAGEPKAYFFAQGRWYEGTPAETAGQLEKLRDPAPVVYLASPAGVRSNRVQLTSGPPAPTGKAELDAVDHCAARQKKEPRRNVLCFQHDGTGWSQVSSASLGTIMRPNVPVLVLAYARSGAVSIQMDGGIGIHVARTADMTAPGGAERVVAHSTADGTPVELRASEREFGPPLPGKHTVTVALGEDAADKHRSASVDLVVEEAYAGAIRLGIGTVFGGGRNRTFSAETLPGSGQAEIVTSEGGALDVELVLGAAAFLERGGRTYVATPATRLAPYVGIGLLNANTTGFEALSSVHLGVEYEISREFSLAVTLVGRKVTRLADGLEVGDPVNMGRVPTRTGYELGVGVVMKVSPDFLKLGKTPGQGFFK